MSNYPDNMDWSQIDGPEDDRDFHGMGEQWGKEVRALIASTIADIKAIADPDEGLMLEAHWEKALEAVIIDSFVVEPEGDDENEAREAFQEAALAPQPTASFLDLAAHIVAPLPEVQP